MTATLEPGTGMPLRDHRIRRYVHAFCPTCHHAGADLPTVRSLPGYLAEAEGAVWLVRSCPIHGRIVTLYDEHPEILTYLEQWTAPTKHHGPDTPGNFDPIPGGYLRGLGELQTQHTCILLEDITEVCDLHCPTCFADAGPRRQGVVPMAEVLANVDQRLARENGRLDVLMLSGGEPTLHPDFAELLDRLIERDIVRILVNTNGVRVARDDAVLAALARHRRRVEVYLQFDGFRAETHRHHRGADLGGLKARAIERLTGAGVFVTLTMTIALGINDDEIGDVVNLAIDTPYVGGVALQPVFGSGRSEAIDPLDRLTHTGTLARLGPQTGGRVTWRDLTALPCSHPHCSSVGYMLRTDRGDWRSLVDLIGHDTMLAHLDLVSNRVVDPGLPPALRALVKESLLGLLSNQSSLSNPGMAELWRNVCTSCDLGVGSLLRLLGSSMGNGERLRRELAHRVTRITVKPFMDLHTMIEERLLQCCVHVGTRSDEQDQCAPFCAVQAWSALGEQKPSSRAGASAEAPVAFLTGIGGRG